MTIRAALARGFTLIEMAIVMVVIGLVLSGGLIAVGPVLQSSKVTETNQKLDRIEQALTLYVIRNGCLPCPATIGSSTSTANSGYAFGTAAVRNGVTTAYYTSGCESTACNSTAQGAVPWVTLGLSEADITDGWGVRIDYAVTAGLVASNGMVRTPPSSYPAGTITVKSPATAGATTQTSEAAYVLVSHGPNRAYGYWSTTATGPIGDHHSSVPELDNSQGVATQFRQGDWLTITTAGTGYFDDIVRFRTAPLIIQLCGSNACGNPA